MSRTTRITAYSNRSIPLAQLRRVWAAVTTDPALTIRELGDLLDIPSSTANLAIQALRNAGYIEQQRGRARARRIVVPFVEVSHGA